MPKVLVVDDDFVTRAVCQSLLEGQGHEVMIAEDGEAALFSAAVHAPDLVIMDLNMPVMAGFDALEKLKAQDTTKDIPVLALTSEFNDSTYDSFYQAGGAGFIQKPIDDRVFLSRINDALT
ncbi:response regulator [Terasakiella sp. A23]|uniref:response regulator n=1 Tax=Terasakiella sp. FCG-A23 TaxID=3080561 RepID=UPI00295419F5|nr:response regulator [Terasakiella sp. A23]MDV7341039.1 response regulator [Terasakiella sp. A23]